MEWISVDERLPNRTDAYFCAFDSGGVWIGWYRLQRYQSKPGTWLIDGDDDLDVTHWMPLPEPPEVK